MAYQNARKLEIQDSHARRIENFARAYKTNRPTIVMIPGGMGSQIDRSTKPFRSRASLPFKKYDPIWMDLGIIFDDEVLQLEIKANGHDLGNHICIPNGPLRFLIEPYRATADFFRDKDYNYIVYAYDWRRPVVESASFLKFFLKLLQSRVQDLRHEDPLPNTTLLCHSMGGLVTKVFLQRQFRQNPTAADVRQWMSRFVTVATPFYGAATHMNRYYKGQEPLNIISGTKPLAKVVGTMPGPYILMFLDRKAYARNADRLEIDRYPVRDSKNKDQEADPYDENLIERYPPWVKKDYLHEAVRLRAAIARPLPDAVAERVFHFRATKSKTWVELHWENVDGSRYDPGKDDSPISGKKGEGDGTVPAWAARLAQIPDSQVFNLTKAKSHGELLEHPETLKGLHHLVNNDMLPRTIQAPEKAPGLSKASLPAVEKFFEDVSKNRIKRDDARATDEKLWRRIAEEVTLC
jgi:pimeloyl-ACP methyl ester carboxylesterase